MNNLFKKVYNKILTKKYQNKVNQVSTLNYGDEFFCFIDMDENTKNLNDDQVASFIYIAYEFPYIYCLYLSDKKENSLTELNYNAYVNLNNIYKIHVKHFIDFKVKTLSTTDIELISKNISTDNEIVKETINNHVNIEVGDIITRNEVKYFVSDVTNDGIIAYRVYFNKGNNYIYLINNMYIDKNEPCFIIRDYKFESKTNIVVLPLIIKELDETCKITYKNIKYIVSSANIIYYDESEVTFNLLTSIKENIIKYIELFLPFNQYINKYYSNRLTNILGP